MKAFEHADVEGLKRLQIFTVTAEGISRNSVFQGSEVFAAFGLAGLGDTPPANPAPA
jgi:hypothetical protein